jgi:ribosome-binding factor A
MPDEIRMRRIEAFFLQELAGIVQRELKNPIFHCRLVSFPSIKVSRDLTTAHVAVSVFGDASQTAEIVKALNDAEPVIRKQIRAVSDLRRTPVFTFHEDYTMENAARMDKILDSLDIPPPEPEIPENGDNDL